jgi:hypothetical protein
MMKGLLRLFLKVHHLQLPTTADDILGIIQLATT